MLNSIYLKETISVIFVALCLTENTLAEYSSDAATGDTINEFNFEDISKGAYSFRYKTPENIQREENGRLDKEGNLVVEGFYSYVDPDGKQQYVSYYADKDGYRIIKIPDTAIASALAFDPNTIASLIG